MTLQRALTALAAGFPVLVADDTDREDEVDVVLAASLATEQWVAWTVRHSSGFLCAPMPAARADALGLPPMVANNQDPRRTAYTVSADASSGITTGISAADRAHTLRVLAAPQPQPADIIRPGHVMPLRARAEGVLERPGHTEAAADLVRLAGAGEVAAIAELVHDDGRMLRADEARALATEAGLEFLTVAELVAWRQEHDPTMNVAKAALGVEDAPVAAEESTAGGSAGETGVPKTAAEAIPSDKVAVADMAVEEIAVADLPTEYGEFRIHAFRETASGQEHVALVSQVPVRHDPALVRVHSECLTGDAFGSLRCDCGPQLHEAMHLVAERGGAVLHLGGHEGRGIGLAAKIAAYALQDQGRDTVEANLDLGLPVDARTYTAAAAILAALGFEDVRLLTNNPLKVSALRDAGIDVVERVPLEVGVSPMNHHYLETKKRSMGHLLELKE
ncbi:MAG: GTP cyclohydrolase II [Cellulomonadaceae bacterium]|jgi:3,4-dihydroxy 2-butanone 4-phosphate synthase/GTP cyclohydrolase II|nr:GTP cyclohydrolase II [Cellulomonadaceae bacterium]